jgi:ribosomal protein S18 acetylase RimI-like enzyme
MSVKSAKPEDLPTIAAIHKAQFSTHFLGQYSTSLLVRFYSSYLKTTILLIHESERGVDGFVLGGKSNDLAGCQRMFVRRNWGRLFYETVLRPRLWPGSLQRSWAALRKRCLRRRQGNKPPVDPVFSILSIAVSKQALGKGVAAALVDAFEQQIRGRITHYELSVRKDNLRAIKFYEKMGFELKADNGVSLRFQKVLRRDADNTPPAP